MSLLLAAFKFNDVNTSQFRLKNRHEAYSSLDCSNSHLLKIFSDFISADAVG